MDREWGLGSKVCVERAICLHLCTNICVGIMLMKHLQN
jgi:hypothetical protein